MDHPPTLQEQQNAANNAAPPPAAAGGNNILLPPSFVEDPVAYLNQIASQQPFHLGVAALAGPIAKWFVCAAPKKVLDAVENSGDGAMPEIHPAVHVASHYLRAAAIQLRDNSNIAGDLEQEMAKTKNQYEVLEAVGAAATLCASRASISSTGILPTLAHLILQQSAADAAPPAAASASAKPSLSSGPSILAQSAANYPTLQRAGVEFLQCALLAEHYRYAARFVQGTWPRPTKTVNIKTVLRYYYLRGLVHLGCGDYVMAHRCWWTCLSVPAEACSAIMVAAWKKLALVQPLLDRTRGVSNVYCSPSKGSSETVSTRFPNSMSKAMVQFLTTGKQQRDEVVMLYTQLGPATEMCKHNLVESLIQTHEALLRTDGNYGLAQQCLQRVRNNQVWEASQLFSTVSVTQLAQGWNIAPEQVTQRLMDSKVPCHLEDDGTVVFSASTINENSSSGLPLPANHHDPSSWVDLSEWMQLLERLQHLELNITTTAKFHAYAEMEKGVSKVAEAMGPRGVEDI